MTRPRFDFSLQTSSSKLQEEIETMLQKTDNILQITVLSYFLLGVLLAPLHNTWWIAIAIGGTNLLLFFIMRFRVNSTELLRSYFSFGLAFFCIQFIIQLQGHVYFHIVLFNTLFLLIILQNRRYFVPYLVITFVFYLIVSVSWFTNDALVSQLITIAEATQFSLYLVIVPLAQAAIFMYFATTFVKKYIFRGMSKAVYIEENLNLNANTELALQIADGDLETPYTLKEGDILGDALMKMRKSLRDLREKDRIQKWKNTGIASISELLLSESNVHRLSSKTLRELIRHMNAHQGAIYLAEKQDDGVVLKMEAVYAGNRRQKMEESVIRPGEGLVGEVFLRKAVVHITKVPDSYQFISSGLGEAKPENVIIVPLNVKEEAVGVIEIASFSAFSDDERIYLENVSESVAVAIASVIAKQETEKLLEEAQQYNQQITAQEAIVKRTLEELENYKSQAELTTQELTLYKTLQEYLPEHYPLFFYRLESPEWYPTYLSSSFVKIAKQDPQAFIRKKSYLQLIENNATVEERFIQASESPQETHYTFVLASGEKVAMRDVSQTIQQGHLLVRIGFAELLSVEE